MGRIATEYLAMKTDPVTTGLMDSDMNDPKFAVKKLVNNATKLGSLGFGTTFLKWVASLAAMSVFFSSLIQQNRFFLSLAV